MTRLAITRRIGEAFNVDGPAEVYVADIGDGWVRLAVDAPVSTHILRSELGTTPHRADSEMPSAIGTAPRASQKKPQGV